MILLFLFEIVFMSAYWLTSWLPDASTLPWGLDGIFVSAFSYFYAFADIFPVVDVVIEAFLIYFVYRLSMMVIKLFIGHRAPVN